MKNIFEGAKFGDMYQCRDDKYKAVFIREWTMFKPFYEVVIIDDKGQRADIRFDESGIDNQIPNRSLIKKL